MSSDDKNPDDQKIPPLSAEYHRARRNLTLTSTVLLFWEFLGLGIATDNQTRSTWGGVKFTIEYSGSIPIFLLAVVVYFGFRLFVEWQQCTTCRRQDSFARLDVNGAFLLAASSIAIYCGQKLLGFDFAPWLEAATSRPVIERLTFLAGVTSAILMIFLLKGSSMRSFLSVWFGHNLTALEVLCALWAIGAILIMVGISTDRLIIIAFASGFSFLPGTAIIYLAYRFLNRIFASIRFDLEREVKR